MKVLMFGWEFPPHLSGGLGTACYGMTRALASRGTEIFFVLPHLGGGDQALSDRLRLHSASGTTLERMEAGCAGYLPGGFIDIEAAHDWRLASRDVVDEVWHEYLHLHPVDSALFAYATERSYASQTVAAPEWKKRSLFERVPAESGSRRVALPDTTIPGVPRRHGEVISIRGGYGSDLMSEVYRYSQAALGVLDQQFDVIHVHDWMTYPAGILVKKITGKPLVAHIHALESDRSGLNMNAEVAAIEKAGMEAADVVVAVSHYTKSRVTALYGIDPDKIEVVHNAVTRTQARQALAVHPDTGEKRVLFMGRVTYQKGPEYFVEAARLVLSRLPDVRFIMAGSGDMLPRMVQRIAKLRMGNRFHFTGFLKGEDVDRMYAMSDLYVMPSVSEPFGIAPLEAMAYDVPVLISRQSGVSEVVRHALKVDFWDTRDMADKICAVLSYPRLAEEMVRNCREELRTIRWEKAADALNQIYERCISGRARGGH